jgi:hypothetical protein
MFATLFFHEFTLLFQLPPTTECVQHRSQAHSLVCVSLVSAFPGVAEIEKQKTRVCVHGCGIHGNFAHVGDVSACCVLVCRDAFVESSRNAVGEAVFLVNNRRSVFQSAESRKKDRTHRPLTFLQEDYARNYLPLRLSSVLS